MEFSREQRNAQIFMFLFFIFAKLNVSFRRWYQFHGVLHLSLALCLLAFVLDKNSSNLLGQTEQQQKTRKSGRENSASYLYA